MDEPGVNLSAEDSLEQLDLDQILLQLFQDPQTLQDPQPCQDPRTLQDPQPCQDPQTLQDPQPCQDLLVFQYHSAADNSWSQKTLQVDLEITCQPTQSVRVRYKTEMEGFQSHGSKGTCGSRLKGRGDNEFVTLKLSSSDFTSGLLLGIPVGNADRFDPFRIVQMHLYDLADGNQNCQDGLYRCHLDLQPGISKDIMLSKIGLVKCTAKANALSAAVDAKNALARRLLLDPPTKMLFNDTTSYHSPLSSGCMPDFKDTRLKILFAFLPSDGVSAFFALTDTVECGAGAQGGKASLAIKAMTPRFTWLCGNELAPQDDVWLQLDSDVKNKSEQIKAQLFLHPSVEGLPAGPPVQVPVEVQRNLVKLQLTKLTSEQLKPHLLPRCRFPRQLLIEKLTSRPNTTVAEVASEELYLVFDYPHSPDVPDLKRRRLAGGEGHLDETWLA